MPSEIVPDVYDITVRADANGRRYRAYLVDGVVPTLFDAGFADTTAALCDGVAATGLTPERLVITHGDPDHVGGFDPVVDRYDVETYVPAATTLETAHAPDNRYDDATQVGGFEAVHIPGHSPDAALVYHGSSVTEGADKTLTRYVEFPGKPQIR
jgi:glyoxylase-like metal-dependent hydrolase (beta-lactamase superfamily II)